MAEIEYKLLNRIMPESENPKCVQEKIDAFLTVNPGIDENAFNEILGNIELSGFRKGMKTGFELMREIYSQ